MCGHPRGRPRGEGTQEKEASTVQSLFQLREQLKSRKDKKWILFLRKLSSLVWTVIRNGALKGCWNSPKAMLRNLNMYLHKDP